MLDMDFLLASLRRSLKGGADGCVRRVGVNLCGMRVELTFELVDGRIPEYHDSIDTAVTEVIADTIAQWGDVVNYSLVTELSGSYSVVLRRDAAPNGCGFVFVAEGDIRIG